MKKLLLFILLVISISLYSGELKTEKDFIAIPVEEEPISNIFLEKVDTKTGIIVFSSTTFIGITSTIINSYRLLNNNVMEPENKDFQIDIMLITSSVIFTAISTVFLRAILAG